MYRISDFGGIYHLDCAHSAVAFTVRYAGLSRVRGTFDNFRGYAIIDQEDPEASAMMVSVSASSINTKVVDRDNHLRSPDFFDVEAFPAITYVGRSFRIVDDMHVSVEGDLTIRDVTRSLPLEFEFTGASTDPFGNQRIGFEAETRISRKDFGLQWNAALETGGWLVGDEINIEIEASAVKQAEDGSGADLATIAAPGAADTIVVASSDECDELIVNPTDAPLPDGTEPAYHSEPAAAGPAHALPEDPGAPRVNELVAAAWREARGEERVRPRRALADTDDDASSAQPREHAVAQAEAQLRPLEPVGAGARSEADRRHEQEKPAGWWRRLTHH